MEEIGRVFILNFLPNNCPYCGLKIGDWDSLSRMDFYAGCSHTCKCGTKYQFVNSEAILEVADDIRYYCS